MRQLISGLIILLLIASPKGRKQARTPAGAVGLYFVAATPPQNSGPGSYPASLYAAGDQHKLRLIRRMFSASDSFGDFADDLHGNMYLAASKGLYVVHEDDPTREDLVPLQNFADFPCWGAIMGYSVPSAVQYCYGDQVVEVLGTPARAEPRIVPGNWAKFRFLQYGGENGGPFQMMPPLAEIDDVNLVMPFSIRPEVVISQLPRELSTSAANRRTVTIVAATDRYLALWIAPEYMVNHTIDTSHLDHAEPLEVLVLDRISDHWRTLEFPTAVTNITQPPIRIFGDWIVTTTMHWNPGAAGSGGGSPGMENERTVWPSSELPDVRDMYYNHFEDLYIPGKLAIQNLDDDRKLTLNTGQEDSEVLLIRADGEILYRVNDVIYSAKIAGNQVTDPTLIVKDVDVPEIHWAFWGPAAKTTDSK